MLSKALRLPAMTRRLLLALLVSLLVHVWMIGGLDGWLTDEASPEATRINVELAPLPAPKPKVAAGPDQPLPAPKRQTTRPQASVSETPVEKPMAPSAVPAPQGPAVEPVSSAPEVVASVPEPEPEAPQPVQTEEPVPMPPSHVAIDYQIVRKGGVAGLEHHSYTVNEAGAYTLTSLAEAKGLLALALSDLVQRSEGQVTKQGLKPTTYLYQYGKNVDKAQKATFDWQGKTLNMAVGSRKQTVELQEGTQDMMSFMYQFMFVPPLQQMQLTVTNGKGLKVYNYDFEGEETLTTQIGPMRTLRIGKHNSDSDEKTELWLAADYHYLPVKISKTEKDGTVTERIATHLQIE